jgi:methylenetetrahydrofolate dehydrogenase (NADP+)/methenyltetrahydrofolate cyclohydrolase
MTLKLGGRELAKELSESVRARGEALRLNGTDPALAIVIATDDGGARWYSDSIVRAASAVGIDAELVSLPDDASEELLRETVTRLGGDREVHGILIQAPLPAGIAPTRLGLLVPPEKDIDAMNPMSLGRLVAGLEGFAPATAAAVVRLLAHHEVDLEGKEVVIAGRSTVVGKPLAHLCLDRNATVTICHSRTRDLASITSRAEVFVAAVGKPELFTAEYVREGAVVVDVGTNETDDGRLVGDVDAASVDGVAGALSPVPGGVGPVTTALLLLNVVQAAETAAGAE